MNNYLDQERVINSAWVNYEGIKKLIPVCDSRAKRIIKEIVVEMKQNNEFYFETRPRLIPTNKVIEKYNIDTNIIRREARKIKEVR